MNKTERIVRDDEIVALYLGGATYGEISVRMFLEAPRIRTILRERGIELEREDGAEDPMSMWNLSDHERRIAIWERARSGARQALGMVFPVINRSHRHENKTGVELAR